MKEQPPYPTVVSEPAPPKRKNILSKSTVIMVIRQHKRLLLCIVTGLGLIVLLSVFLYFSVPGTAQFNEARVAVNEPIAISFSRPMRSSMNYRISPSTEGTWHTVKDVFGGVTQLTFQAAHPLLPNATYRLTLVNVHTMLGVTASKAEQVMSLTTQQLQPVTVTAPSADTSVPITTMVTVHMSYPNNGVRKLVLISTAAKLVSPDPVVSEDKQFEWRFAQPLKQGQTYSLALMDMDRPNGQQLLKNLSFTTVSQPQITQSTTTDHLYPNQPITIAFDQAMQPSTKDFTFSCAGTGKWQDAHTYSYVPTVLPPATACTYTVLKGSRDTQGGVTEADKTYAVSSPGAAHILAATPGGSSVSLGSSINLTFDQPVDHTSAQNAFSISPSINGSTSWNGNTLIFKPTGLDYQTAYTVSIKAGVVATYGLPSARAFSASFTTVVQTIKLAVPAYKQQYALSCEESSLRMALAYRGIAVSDMDVLQAVGYNPQPRDTTTNTWQDPYQMYVGDVNGKEDVTGWGTYGPPIAAAAGKLGRNASYISGITTTQISQAIHSNNPVVLWGVVPNKAPQMDSWNTATSGIVSVIADAHVRTVYGVVGSPNSPIGFYLHDPIYGDIYWSTAQLNANMFANGLIGTQGVIVY